MESPAKQTRAGRPRAFDREAALDKAMHLFWRKGYEGTSIGDLTEAMGINPPSLYAAFGNKEALFRQVLERYAQGPAGYVLKALDAPTAREAVEQRLYGAVEVMCDPERPAGCLAVQAAARCGELSTPASRDLATFCDLAYHAFAERFRRAQQEGELSQDADPQVLARYVNALAQGISLQAASGAPKEELRGMVELAMRSWPWG